MNGNDQKIFRGAGRRDDWQKLRGRKRSHSGKFQRRWV